MQRLLAIAALTWKAAFRFRLFWVLMTLLLGAVVALPLLLKDDGTARGFTQILLTYTLSIITALLGLATLWISCGTLAREIEECQIQMLAAKPIARWQIWLGKWLGILCLNAVLLAVAGAGVFVLLKWRARQLPEPQQAVLRNEIFVARASLKPPLPDIEADLEQAFQAQIQKNPVPPSEYPLLRDQLRQRIRAFHQLVPSGYARDWIIDLGLRKNSLRDQPLFLRAKFHVAQTNLSGTYLGIWQVGPADGSDFRTREVSLAANAFHEFDIPPNLFDQQGQLRIRYINRDNTVVLFPLEDGLEVLYREGGFGLNFARGLGIILCWLALLSALGLSAASFLSFPVAAFFSLSLLFVVLSSGTMQSVVEEGGVFGAEHESGQVEKSFVDIMLLPFFRAILWVVKLVGQFSPVASLSTGRSITWGQLGLAWGQTVLLLGGLIALGGMLILSRRELATAQGTS